MQDDGHGVPVISQLLIGPLFELRKGGMSIITCTRASHLRSALDALLKQCAVSSSLLPIWFWLPLQTCPPLAAPVLDLLWSLLSFKDVQCDSGHCMHLLCRWLIYTLRWRVSKTNPTCTA